MKPEIDRESRFLPTPPAFDALVVESPSEYLPYSAITFGVEKKLKWCSYSTAKKFEDMITRFDRIHERNRQTDERTDGRTPHDGINRAYA